MNSPTAGMWECVHGVDGRDDCGGCGGPGVTLATVMALVDEFGWACVDMGATRGGPSVPQEHRARIVAALEQAGLR